jgi:hypothetical protein
MPLSRSLNQEFFKTWTPEMAYVLGYIAADGTISIGKRGNCYLMIEATDRELTYFVRRALGSNHFVRKRKREERWRSSYVLQIGSKEIVADLAKLGLTPKKSKRLRMPVVPKELLHHFVRGYFDGDGNVQYAKSRRKNRPPAWYHYTRVLFTSSSLPMIDLLKQRLRDEATIVGGHIKCYGNYYRLYYYRMADIEKFYRFLYQDAEGLYLKRKFRYFKEALRKMKMGA